MKTRIIILSTLALMSCKKDPVQQTPSTCDCYEYHEALEPVGFPIQTQWVYDYSTTPIPDLCEKDNGTWIYNSNSTQRYKYICQ